MPSNISLGDGLWTSASSTLKERRPRKLKGAPMKERLSNFSDNDDSGVSQVSTSSNSSSKDDKVVPNGKNSASPLPPLQFQSQQSVESSISSSLPDTASPGVASTPTRKNNLFGRLKSMKGQNSLDVFHFDGEGLQFRAKLIGIKDVDAARGDEMCQQAMTELNKGLKQSKEHKTKIMAGVSLTGLKIKDEKGTIVMHQHPIPKISYIWRDQADPRSFGYVYGLPDSGHRFFAIKAEKSADALVGAIHQLFQVAFRMKQHEVDMAKKGQDTDTVSNDGSDSSGKKENTMVNGSENETANHNGHSHKVDEANLLDLEGELEVLSQGLEQIKTVQATTTAWADFGGNSANPDSYMSSASSTSSSSDPWGRGISPQSLRTITPDPFDNAFGATVPSPPNPLMQAAPRIPARPVPATTAPWPSSAFGVVPQVAQSVPTDSIFGNSVTPFPSPAHSDFAQVPVQNVSVFGDPVSMFGDPFSGPSVFDPPPPLAPVVTEKKPVDPFSTELFGDLRTIGETRQKKMSRDNFPQPVKPKLGDLRGEPSVITPSPVTVDPFLINATLFSGNSSSNLFGGQSSTSLASSGSFGSSGFDQFSQSAPAFDVFALQGPVRKVSDTNAPFVAGGPMIPPRPVPAQNGFNGAANPFVISAPPVTPRRPTNAPPVVSGLSFSMQQQSPSSVPLMPKIADPFGDNFFGN